MGEDLGQTLDSSSSSLSCSYFLLFLFHSARWPISGVAPSQDQVQKMVFFETNLTVTTLETQALELGLFQKTITERLLYAGHVLGPEDKRSLCSMELKSILVCFHPIPSLRGSVALHSFILSP